jgi:hypothetical protein
MRQARNRVTIEGILSEIELKYGSFMKNGASVESIGGLIKVRTTQVFNGEEKTLEIPVHMFATKITNSGSLNPAFQSIERVMNTYVSIAAAGEEKADRVRITGGQIQMNEFYNQNGSFVSYPRITTSFITNNVKREEYSPKAEFTLEMVVASKGPEINVEGEDTGRYKVTGIVPQYGDKVDVVPFFCSNDNVANAVDTYWNEGDTVSLSGKINFSSKTEKKLVEQDFGEPVEKINTINVSDLIITGGDSTPLEGEFAFATEEIQAALGRRKAALEERKAKDLSRVKTHATPTIEAVAKGGFDVGF